MMKHLPVYVITRITKLPIVKWLSSGVFDLKIFRLGHFLLRPAIEAFVPDNTIAITGAFTYILAAGNGLPDRAFHITAARRNGCYNSKNIGRVFTVPYSFIWKYLPVLGKSLPYNFLHTVDYQQFTRLAL